MKIFVYIFLSLLFLSSVSAMINTTDSKMILYYNLNETTGTLVNNLANGTNFNATLIGSMAFNSTKLGGGARAGASGNNYLNLTNNKPLGLNSSYTFNLWINTTLPTGTINLFADSSDSFLFRVNNGTTGNWTLDNFADGTANDRLNFETNVSYTANNWTMLTFGANLTHQWAAINGLLVGQIARSGTAPAEGVNTFIGTRSGAGLQNTTLSLIGIWNRSINNTEISQLWNNGAGLAYPFTSNSISLSSPATGTNIANASTNFNASLSIPNTNWTNATFNLWFSNGTKVITLTNSTVVPTTSSTVNFNTTIPQLTSYVWNINACDINSNCYTNPTNNSFNFGLLVNTINYNATTTGAVLESFFANATIPNGYSLSQVNLIYNGTSYGNSITSDTAGNIITIKQLITTLYTNNQNISFYYNYVFSNGVNLNSSNYTQAINLFTLDGCTANTNKIINFSNFDQDTQLQLFNNSTYNLQVRIGNPDLTNYVQYANNISSTTAAVCMSINLTNTYRMDVIMQSNRNSSYFTQFYNIQNYTLTNSSNNINISLYDLLVSSGQTFHIVINDANYIPLSNAVVQIDRQYVQNGAFTTVEIPVTDVQGGTIGHFILNNQLYNIYIKKNGQLIAAFLNQQMYCNPLLTDCILPYNLQQATITPINLGSNGGVSATSSYNDSTRTYTLQFTSLNGSASTVSVTGVLLDNFQNQTLCSASTTSLSNSLSCTIPSSYQNKTVLFQSVANGVGIEDAIIRTGYTSLADLSPTRYILAAFLIPALVLMAGASGAMALLFFIVGIIIATSVYLINPTSSFGPASFIGFFVAAAVIIIWKINNGGFKNG